MPWKNELNTTPPPKGGDGSSSHSSNTGALERSSKRVTTAEKLFASWFDVAK
jgi:hypothetical protein